MKTCIRCKIDKALTNFNIRKDSKDGFTNTCKMCHKILCSQRYLTNKTNVIEKSIKWKKNNKSKVIESHKKYQKKKRANDELLKVKESIRRSILRGLKGEKKTIKSIQIIGCSWEQLKHHLEIQFQEGMTWDNHGQYGWHIDHIRPLASAKTQEEIYNLNYYTNLQPLWWEDNIKKGDKLVWNK
jgi:hypothetical protein